MDEHQVDRVLGSEGWLTHFAAVAGDADGAAIIRAMLEKGVSEPATAVAMSFQLTGVPYRREGDALILGSNAI